MTHPTLEPTKGERRPVILSGLYELCHSEYPNPNRRTSLQPIQVGYPLELVAMDLTGPFPKGPCGNRYILVAGDYFMKWMEAYAVPDQEATTVVQKLVDAFFCRFSVPSRLHSDRGKRFESKVISAICQLLQIVKSRTTSYSLMGLLNGSIARCQT